MGFPYRQIVMCAYKITPMHSCTYKMQPIYYIAPYTEFLIATKLNQCYGGNAKPIAALLRTIILKVQDDRPSVQWAFAMRAVVLS